MNRD
ncbi:unnamed protein product [Rhodiola kirilowii]